ncbi:uncharacterized protein LOC116428193 isoform X2 [Nomia melanderi]|uniref:uncharacterized protein LOC116428193 isoform X2 n=1 Tax=Nomia melanderi TaxID=2448451 RepID=UPI00130473E4|nr:uncharacterized protein LOC116428193 isoform X1 [Nomia melanderi]XP_031835379.1 uncharacterized protein LOC116428193 isoform X1 [Nomia melanderi]XP_031835380.1 uncharacterized protein LOC116428193 isoform X1 [Nomia melanderi]XP_031835381.1 uncharacterized protein LOC116428193 isoform X1 [Nomia melanderi]XP_031835382.1 uncharacterized protein LOC116428193 isoform X1 [Nomia melanderi]XP_031835383.1 uncharacterized protein LOC116428193 isoform X1 [Nomia melanderi]XP_031835384.1 uncharacterize
MCLWSVLMVLLLLNSSGQQPTFFKSVFKGLIGVTQRTRPQVHSEITAVYYHEQTIAVVEIGNNNELNNCNLIEVYEQDEANEILRNLSATTIPQQVSFREITKLMQQCELLDKIQHDVLSSTMSNALSRGTRVMSSSLSLLSGILPGTKWCGTGDIAESYHDLGQDVEIDRCCRSHDLCPVKVRAQQTRYNLTNYSLYTKSHCVCDEALYRCLKASKHPTANIMGHIYFNLVRVPCIEDISRDDHSSIGIRRQFIPAKMNY